MEPVKSVRSQFFSQACISQQPQQGLYQPWIVFSKEFLEIRVGGHPGLDVQKHCFVTLPHTYKTSPGEKS